jgi:hypothetical protein
MKTLAFLFLFCAAAYGADTVTTNVVGDITTRISERTSAPAHYLETSHRGNKEVMQLMGLPIGNGLSNLSRSYYAGGELLFMEEDDNGDGIFEGITVMLPNSDDLEIFTREPDGSMKPVSTERIRLVKKQIATTSETNDKLFFSKKKPSEVEIGKLLKQNREKLEKLQKQEIAATNASPDVTTKVEEHKDIDGNPDLRVETTYRGAKRILRVVSRPNKERKMAVWSRTYSVNGKSIATDSDDDGDGMFESLMLHSPDSDDLEIFRRKGDGTVMPTSTAEIELVKKESSIALEPLAKGIQNPNMSDEELGKAIEESRQKIQELDQTNGIH